VRAGTSLRFRPGVLTGGGGLSHDCGRERAVGFFAEALVLLALFSKKVRAGVDLRVLNVLPPGCPRCHAARFDAVQQAPRGQQTPLCTLPTAKRVPRVQALDIELRGLTSSPHDVGTDAFRAATLPLLCACGLQVTYDVKQRAVGPDGAGAVRLAVANARSLEQPISLTDEGLVRRIRGVAWTVNMGAQYATSLFSSAKGVLLQLLADVTIFTDVVSARHHGVRRGLVCAALRRCHAPLMCSNARSLAQLWRKSTPAGTCLREVVG
jgi:RNA 3'-terminal phosphate cyclase-like protein